MKMLLFLLLLISLPQSAIGQNKAWFGGFLKLSEKRVSRRDVERFLGREPSKTNDNPRIWGELAYYEIEHGKVEVYYSKGGCRLNPPNGWDISDGIVMSLDFKLRNPIDWRKTGLASPFLVEKREDDNANYQYHERKRGVMYSVFDRKLKEISFVYDHSEPPRCANAKE